MASIACTHGLQEGLAIDKRAYSHLRILATLDGYWYVRSRSAATNRYVERK